MLYSADSETTGVDHYHGARPFFFTMADEEGGILFWEWEVNPLNRSVKIPDEDKQEITSLLRESEGLVLQNGKFDAAAFSTIGIKPWPWNKTHDTLIAGHLLASNQPHDLTSMVLIYLGVDISGYETRLMKAVNEARGIVRRQFPLWRIAKEGLKEMPSARGGEDKKAAKGVQSDKPLKFDMWLPRQLAKKLGYPDDHPWYTLLQEYANADSSYTLPLWKAMEAELKRRGLCEIYECRRQAIPIVHKMERNGATYSEKRRQELTNEYRTGSENAARTCLEIAKGYNYELELPKKGANNSLRNFVVGPLGLPPIRDAKAKTDLPSLKAELMKQEYLYTTPTDSKQHIFIKNLIDKSRRDTAVSYLESYHKFRRPLPGGLPDSEWQLLHFIYNMTGTDTLRFSCSNPNGQNISKKEDFNLRYCFGPAPGREWWSLDAKNIELRLPAYEAQEMDFIALFERPDDPPYFGSNHLLIAHLLFPKEFDQCIRDGVSFKDRYKATLYQRVKNGNFAVQYGAVDKADGTGTADRTYGIKGAQAIIKARFEKQEQLNQKCIAFAKKHGYVETIPDRTVCPERGYPLLCARTSFGGILPTVPLNYHVQGTAMWWTMKAMIRCQPLLDQWSREAKKPDHYRIALQIHDEIVFDFPKAAHPLKNSGKSNLRRVKELQKAMEMGGIVDLGIPTPVDVEYNEDSWATGVRCSV